MRVFDIDNIEVTGLIVRTTNDSEMNPLTAKIGKLWENFYSTAAPKLSENAKIYGLYTNYESDENGAFDVVACTDTVFIESLEPLEKFQILAGKYLKFTATGEMPQAVIDLWGKIWDYFNSERCIHKRAYLSDFEYYKSSTDIEIYIGIEDCSRNHS